MRKLPKLVELKDIKGDLHTHTNHNWISSHDAGLSSMQEMVNKAAQLSYQYIALGDHNPSISSYSNTKLLSLIKDRKNKIDKLKSLREAKGSKRPIKILNTLEIDIRANGSLSLPDKAVDMLDFATVSVHSSMKMKTDKMTQRVLAGLSHSKALILGHPTGRLINKRSSYQLNWDKIFDFCARNNKVIEINAHPKRLDLPDILVKEAIKSKVMLAINTDAHSTEHLDLMAYGLSVARRGWAQKKHILNTLTWNKLRDKINLS